MVYVRSIPDTEDHNNAECGGALGPLRGWPDAVPSPLITQRNARLQGIAIIIPLWTQHEGNEAKVQSEEKLMFKEYESAN